MKDFNGHCAAVCDEDGFVTIYFLDGQEKKQISFEEPPTKIKLIGNDRLAFFSGGTLRIRQYKEEKESVQIENVLDIAQYEDKFFFLENGKLYSFKGLIREVDDSFDEIEGVSDQFVVLKGQNSQCVIDMETNNEWPEEGTLMCCCEGVWKVDGNECRCIAGRDTNATISGDRFFAGTHLLAYDATKEVLTNVDQEEFELAIGEDELVMSVEDGICKWTGNDPTFISFEELRILTDEMHKLRRLTEEKMSELQMVGSGSDESNFTSTLLSSLGSGFSVGPLKSTLKKERVLDSSSLSKCVFDESISCDTAMEIAHGLFEKWDPESEEDTKEKVPILISLITSVDDNDPFVADALESLNQPEFRKKIVTAFRSSTKTSTHFNDLRRLGLLLSNFSPTK